jgi:hypothetical protein
LSIAYIAEIIGVCCLALVAFACARNVPRALKHERMELAVMMGVLGLLAVAAVAQIVREDIWPQLGSRSIAVLVDDTYSMVDRSRGMRDDTIVRAAEIAEKTLPRKLLWDREYVYNVSPDFARKSKRVVVDRSKGEPRIRLNTTPNENDRYSDYLDALETLGRLLKASGGERSLIVVGDLLHQKGPGVTSLTGDPPRPAGNEKSLFSGTQITLVYPDTLPSPDREKVLGFWKKYFRDRSIGPDSQLDSRISDVSFTVAELCPPIRSEHPVYETAIGLPILLGLSILAALCIVRLSVSSSADKGSSTCRQ